MSYTLRRYAEEIERQFGRDLDEELAERIDLADRMADYCPVAEQPFDYALDALVRNFNSKGSA